MAWGQGQVQIVCFAL